MNETRLPLCAALPCLPDVHVSNAVYVRVVNKLSSKGIKQKRVMLLKPGALVLGAEGKRSAWSVARYVSLREVDELVVGSDSLLFKVPGSFDLVVFFSQDARNVDAFSMHHLLAVIRTLATEAGHTIKETPLQPGQKMVALANLHKNAGHLPPHKRISTRKASPLAADSAPSPSPQPSVGTSAAASATPLMPPSTGCAPSEPPASPTSPAAEPSPPVAKHVVVQKEGDEALGLVFGDGLSVVGVKSGSAAERNGLRRYEGWVLTHVQQKEVRHAGDVATAAAGNDVLSLTLTRDEAASGGDELFSCYDEDEGAEMKDILVRDLLAENAAFAEQLQMQQRQIAEQAAHLENLQRLCKHLDGESAAVAAAAEAEANVESDRRIQRLEAELVEARDERATLTAGHERCNYRLHIVMQEKDNLREAIAALKQQITLLHARLKSAGVTTQP